ncbi:DUF4175 family protein, partial [Candidatus Latescibacterota bacterium]
MSGPSVDELGVGTLTMDSASYKNIVARMDNISQRYVRVGLYEAVLMALAAGVWLTVIFSLYESFLYCVPPIKKVIVSAIIIVTILIFCISALIRFFGRPDRDVSARMAERVWPQLGDRLISAVQLGRLNTTSLQGQSAGLVNALTDRVDEETKTLDIQRAVSMRRVIVRLRILYGSLVAALLLGSVFPGHVFGGLFRLTDYNHEYLRPGGIMIYTTGHDESVIRGDDFSTTGFVNGGNGGVLNILYRWKDTDTWSVKPVDYDHDSGTFNVSMEKPRTSFNYQLEMDSYSTSRLSVTVIERPEVERLDLTVTYPSYMGMGNVDNDDNEGNLHAPSGSGVKLSVTANKPLAEMTIHWSDSTLTACETDGVSGVCSFVISRDIDYYIGLVDTLGIINSHPISYRIVCLKDEAPVADILSPQMDIVLPRAGRFPLVYRARDDFGISEVSLTFMLPYEKEPRIVVLAERPRETDLFGEFDMNLSDTNLLPDDTVTYYLTVYDNDTVNGPKKGVSDTLTVRVPSITELLNDSVAEQENGLAKLRDMAEQTERQNSNLDEVRRNIKSSKEIDWSEKNTMEEATDAIESMRDELKDLSDSIKETA